MLLDLAKMRRLRWGERAVGLAASVRQMPLEHGCSWFAVQASLCVGDQELVSYACAQTPGACGNLLRGAHADRCQNTGPWNRGGAVVYHFNW